MALSRDEILASIDLPTDTLEVPEWGGEIIVKGAPLANERLQAFVNAPVNRGSRPADLTPKDGNQVDRALEKVLDQAWTTPSPDEKNRRTLVGLVVLCVVDDEGNRLFSWSDADALREKNWNVVARVANRALELAAGGLEGVEEGKGS